MKPSEVRYTASEALVEIKKYADEAVIRIQKTIDDLDRPSAYTTLTTNTHYDRGYKSGTSDVSRLLQRKINEIISKVVEAEEKCAEEPIVDEVDNSVERWANLGDIHEAELHFKDGQVTFVFPNAYNGEQNVLIFDKAHIDTMVELLETCNDLLEIQERY